MEFFIILIAFVVLDIIALRYSFDSRDNWNSIEWERRRNWKALH